MFGMYCKCYASGKSVLYDARGNVCGRGRTDSSGKTVFVDLSGKVIGKSYDCFSGRARLVSKRDHRAEANTAGEIGFIGQALVASAILLGLYVLMSVLVAL